MHQPRAGVVGLEGQREITAAGQHGDVAAGWVYVLEVGGACLGIILGAALGENDKVGPVEVDWMCWKKKQAKKAG